MLNQVILVGRVEKLDKAAGILSIKIKRTDDKESDLILVSLNEGLVENIVDYITEGSTIGIKASLKIDNNILRIVAEKLTFINTKQE